MAVEILILSGVRQGERVVLDATNFRAGSSPDCAVFFDPLQDTSTANRSASFRLMEDGWYMVHTTGTILINQRTVSGPTRIRSGDVVRMSECGPDFSFCIVASTASTGTKRSGAATNAPTVSGTVQNFSSKVGLPVDSTVTMTPISPTASAPSSITPPSSAQQEITTLSSGAVSVPGTRTPASTMASSPMVLITLEQNKTRSGIKESWILWIASGLAICVLLALLIRGLSPPTVQVTLNTPLVSREDGITVAKEDKKNAPLIDQAPPASPTEATPASTPQQTSPSAQPPTPTKEEQIAAKLKDVVFLIQVEKSGNFWPFATCCAIGKNTLLTSAREASMLSRWRTDPQKGFKIWITNPANGIKMAIQDIYVNAVFITLEDKPDDWIYYDLALLTVAEELPKIIPLASLEEIANLKAGLPLYCCGFTHEGEKITEFDNLQSHLTRGNIFIITAPPNLPSHPRLLHIKGKIFKNAFGSPIVNDQGKVVAVYGEALQPERDAGDLTGQKGMEIHYATVLNRELINLGLKHNYGKIWVLSDLQKTGLEQSDER